MGIVKPKFTRRNEIWCRIYEIEDLSKNVDKTEDRTYLNGLACFETIQKQISELQLGQTMLDVKIFKQIGLL